MNTIIKYLQDSRQELRKVSWPSKQETTNSTLLVIGVSLAVAAFLGAIDYGFNRLLEFLLQRF
ncbi:MAG: preprotein translocase subunit SecE [Candidatus Komeilibacteria bacterium RIFCSPLOWO2_02_FULL_48_11]|uniref:Protein translocase subunit SecE n=1 Tax=Candidatus Komeilibacteria bacterium RIFCSPLOWO2_02_FULL_48_11 TaxID=1798553 RepID=A0A1G2BVB1_9BACT|nr:MAG: preprotein translocase subunit SecE [Candidatus Komeilibacteria bacterium RIFCSPLOWO2_02_FULL_48_11]